jgi:symplekin
MLRPTIRDEAVDVLLSLTTHSGKLTRNAAIMTVKRWVPETEPLSTQVLQFALALFSRLEIAPLPIPVVVSDPIKDESMELSAAHSAVDESEKPPEPIVVLASHAEVQGGRVVGGLLPPTTLSQVVQHVELLLALCAKSPELLHQ